MSIFATWIPGGFNGVAIQSSMANKYAFGYNSPADPKSKAVCAFSGSVLIEESYATPPPLPHEPLLKVDGSVDAQSFTVKSLTVNGKATFNAPGPVEVLAPLTVKNNANISPPPGLSIDSSKPLLTITDGLIVQVETSAGGGWNKLDGKYMSIGSSPELPPPLSDAVNPDDYYGIRMHWGTDFAMLQLVSANSEVNSGGSKDTVLAWGDDPLDLFRIKFVGRIKTKIPGQSAQYVNTSRDVVVIHPHGGMRVKGKGKIKAKVITSLSDMRLKESIEPIADALDKVMCMRGVSYNWKPTEFVDDESDEGRCLGLIAQELEEVCPNLVSTDEEGYKAIDYGRITPVLIEAIKQQQKIIESQKVRMDRLEEALRKLGALS